MKKELTISHHAYNQGITRFGFDARAIANIIHRGDTLNQQEKELIWNSRPTSRKLTTKNTTYYYDPTTAAVIVTTQTPNGITAITIYEAQYINHHRQKDTWTPPPKERNEPPSRIRNTKRAQACITRQQADKIWEQYRQGTKIIIKGTQQQLFVDDQGNITFTKENGKTQLLIHYRNQDIIIHK